VLAIATSRGDGAAAVEAAAEALALAPEDPAVLQYAALAWRAAGDLAQAEAYARRAANRDPGTRSQLVLADVLARQGRRADAEASYRAVLEWEPASAVALNRLARRWRRRGRDRGLPLSDYLPIPSRDATKIGR
jgi:tetratricopeptide (TPR) repeat protein